jgi:hypothetical protein
MTQNTDTRDAAISNAGDATSDKLVTILVGQGERGVERLLRLGGLAARAFRIAALTMPAATGELGEQGWAAIDAASVEAWEAIAAAGDVGRGDERCSQPCLATYAAFVTACGDTGRGEAVRLLALHASHYSRVLRALDGAPFAELAAGTNDALQRLDAAADALAGLARAGNDLARAALEYIAYFDERFEEVVHETEHRIAELETSDLARAV